MYFCVQQPLTTAGMSSITLPPALWRYILSFLRNNTQLHIVAILRRTCHRFKRIPEAAPFALHYQLVCTPSTAATHARSWMRSAKNVLVSMSVYELSEGVFARSLQDFNTLQALTMHNPFRGATGTGALLSLSPSLVSFAVSNGDCVTDASLANLLLLQHLAIDSCSRLQGTVFASLTNLTCLVIRNCEQVGATEGCAPLPPLLQILHIVQCVRFPCTAIASLSALVSLEVFGCPRLTDECIANLPSLQQLCVGVCPQLRGATLASLAKLTSLEVSDCGKVTDRRFAELPLLLHLGLDMCYQLRGTAFATLTQLTSLDLSACPRITEASLMSLPHLQKVGLEACSQLQGNAFSCWTRLTSLEVFSCHNVTDEGFMKLPTLRHLCVDCCPRLRGTFLPLLSALTSLTIMNCHLITEANLSMIVRSPYLRHFRVANNN